MRLTMLLLCVIGTDAATTYPYTYMDCGVAHTISAAPTKVVTVCRHRARLTLDKWIHPNQS